jgi:hypothetical protein
MDSHSPSSQSSQSDGVDENEYNENDLSFIQQRLELGKEKVSIMSKHTLIHNIVDYFMKLTDYPSGGVGPILTVFTNFLRVLKQIYVDATPNASRALAYSFTELIRALDNEAACAAATQGRWHVTFRDTVTSKVCKFVNDCDNPDVVSDIQMFVLFKMS